MVIDAHKFFRDAVIDDLRSNPEKNLHIIVIATKPDIIKQAPLFHELKNRKQSVLLCHTGQHYDYRYSGGMEEEFSLTPDIHLGIEGSLHEKIAQMIERFGEVIKYLLSIGKMPIPYIHGDTTTSMAIGLASFMHRVGCVHSEAGLRTLTPKKVLFEKFYRDFKQGSFSWDEYYGAMKNKNNFEPGSMEPFPEQYNTRVSEPASGFFAAPVELNREFLLSEGFPSDRVVVTGNAVADATMQAVEQASQSTILQKYPQLKSGEFIRFCIHRRENTENQKRFTILIDSIEKLVKNNRSVLLISLFGTEQAIDRFGLRKRIEKLSEGYPSSFIYSDVWPYYKDVIAAMKVCGLVATDSGSMQEEMNIIGIPTVTLRFGSDRAESIFAGSNVIAPPVDSDFVVKIINCAFKNKDMAKTGNIYGENVAKKIIDEVILRLDRDEHMFRTEEERIGINF